MKKIIFIWLLFMSPLLAQAAHLCPPKLEAMPILHGGRVKPLLTHAKESLKFISGKSSWHNLSPTELYCRLSFDFWDTAVPEKIEIPLLVNHVETRAFLGVDSKQSFISFKEAKTKEAEVQKLAMTLEQKKDASAFAKDLKALAMRLQLYEDITEGHNWLVPTPKKDASKQFDWISLREFQTRLLTEKKLDESTMAKALLNLGHSYTKASDKKHLLELKYEKLHLFHWAMLAILSCLAMGLLFRQMLNKYVVASLIAVFALEIAGITLRIMISGRGPVTNMYETVLWVGVGGLFFASILALAKNENLFLQVGLALNLACLFMMTFATDMLDPAIKPLVPVLRDNFWLSTHVTTITISYAAFALSWILANTHMLKSFFSTQLESEARHINNLCYDCLKIGIVLLALGIILGGIWADYSWGRFWGWDPKETWALAALMGYMAILHGRYAGWIKPRLFIPLTALAFLGIIMAWFGVNYILAAGLHSYGFSQGGSIFISSLAGVQIVIFIFYLLRARQTPVVSSTNPK